MADLGSLFVVLTKIIFVGLQIAVPIWSQTPPPLTPQRGFFATPPPRNQWGFPTPAPIPAGPQQSLRGIPRNPNQLNFAVPGNALGTPDLLTNSFSIGTQQTGPAVPMTGISSPASLAPGLNVPSRTNIPGFAPASNAGTFSRNSIFPRASNALPGDTDINTRGFPSQFQSNSRISSWSAPSTTGNTFLNPTGNTAPFQNDDPRNFIDITQQWNTNAAVATNNLSPPTGNRGRNVAQMSTSNSSSEPLVFESAFPGFPRVTIPDFGRDSWHDFLKQLLDRHHPNIPPLTRTSDPSMEPIPRRVSDLPRGVSPIYIRNSRGTPAYVPFSLPNRQMNILVPFDRQSQRLAYPYLPLYIPYAGFNVQRSGRRFLMYLPFQPDRFRTSREGAPIAVPQENSNGLFPNYVDFRPRAPINTQ